MNGLIKGAYGTLTEDDKAWYEHSGNRANLNAIQINGLANVSQSLRDWYASWEASAPGKLPRILAALEDQSLANPWIITLQRVSELRLDTFTKSDFYGGMRGFLDSFGIGHARAALGTARYEDIDGLRQGGLASSTTRVRRRSKPLRPAAPARCRRRGCPSRRTRSPAKLAVPSSLGGRSWHNRASEWANAGRS